MSTIPATLDDILAELKSIRELLAARPASIAAKSPANGSVPDSTAEIGQPTTLIDNPGDVQVHFGKNTGISLSNLGERSLSWYATEQPARLDSSGKPYPRRPVETALLNAARQLWHTQKGTLAGTGSGVSTPAPQRPPTTTQHNLDDENVPF